MDQAFWRTFRPTCFPRYFSNTSVHLQGGTISSSMEITTVWLFKVFNRENQGTVSSPILFYLHEQVDVQSKICG